MKSLDVLKRGLCSYIRVEGYTKSSLAKKCSIDMRLFKDVLSKESKVDIEEQEKIILKVMELENLSVEDLKQFIFHESQTKMIAEIKKAKELEKFKKRDASRISPFLEELEEFWLMNPDLRFGQLIEIISKGLDTDQFNAEDDKWLKSLREVSNRYD